MTWDHLRGTWSIAYHVLAPKHPRFDRPNVLRRRGDGALAIPAFRQNVWYYMVVSREDAWACGYNWFVAKSGYAQRNHNKRTEYIHRLVMGHVIYPESPETGLEPTTNVDHRNRRQLDNTRRNLRMLTQSDQNRNQERNDRKDVGVVWDEAKGKWLARIKHLGREHFVGRFRSRHAAIARRTEVLRRMGLVEEPEPVEPAAEAL